MIEKLFSILMEKMLPKEMEEEIPTQEILERNFTINKKLSSLNSEQIENFKRELLGIAEFKDRCAEYGAKDPVGIPFSDIVTIKENLYKKLYSS